MNFAYAIGKNIFPHKGLKIPNKLEETLKKIKKVLIGLTIGDAFLFTGALLTGVFIVLGGTLLNLFAFGIALKVAAVALFVIATLFFASTIFGIVNIAIKSKKIPPKKSGNLHELDDKPKILEKVEIPKEIKEATDEQLIENYRKEIFCLNTQIDQKLEKTKNEPSTTNSVLIDEDLLQQYEKSFNYLESSIKEIIERIEKNKNENLKKKFSESSHTIHILKKIILEIKLESNFQKNTKHHEIIGKGFLILLDILKYCDINKKIKLKENDYFILSKENVLDIICLFSKWITKFSEKESSKNFEEKLIEAKKIFKYLF